jgi:glycosyltransferase involved in cell wall biosynthesis
MINEKSVSLAMVVYNDSEPVSKLVENLRKPVSSVIDIKTGKPFVNQLKFIDEVIIVDQGSDEKHSEVFKKCADIYHRTTNKGNADYDRQFCYSLCNSEFILALDSDEYISNDNILILIDTVTKYNPDLIWFLFHNTVKFQDFSVDLKELLGDDPHPRFWRKEIVRGGQRGPTLVWLHQAHVFPQIHSENVIYAQCYIEHNRELIDVLNRHIHRGKNIEDQGRAMEKQFITTLLKKFNKEVNDYCFLHVPELKEYLK